VRTQTHVPAEPETSARPAVPPAAPALHLAYATPQPKQDPLDFGDVLAIVIRRLVFAVGVGMLTYGVVYSIASPRREDPATVAGVGAGLVALVVPFRKLSAPPRMGRKD
jgi:hypothetical protein